jgi:hypothetical protein
VSEQAVNKVAANDPARQVTLSANYIVANRYKSPLCHYRREERPKPMLCIDSLII